MIFNSELIEGNVSISLSPENELEKRMVKNYNIVEGVALYANFAKQQIENNEEMFESYIEMIEDKNSPEAIKFANKIEDNFHNEYNEEYKNLLNSIYYVIIRECGLEITLNYITTFMRYIPIHILGCLMNENIIYKGGNLC